MLFTNLAAILTETHFDMTVTLGNVLTILAFAAAAMAYGLRLESKITLHEEAIKLLKEWVSGHAECSKQQTEILTELRAAIAYIRGRNGYHERVDD